MQVLEEHLPGVRHGQGHALLLRAPAGMGKSRLLQELVSRAETDGVRVFAGRAFEVEAEFPYAVVADLFQPYLRAHPERLKELIQQSPDLAGLFPTTVSGLASESSQPPASKIRLFEAFLTCLGALCASQPALVILDDIHWADPASLDLIHYVTHNLDGLRLLLVMASRSEGEMVNEPLQNVVASLSRTGHLTVVPLAPLSLTDVAEMTRQLLQMEEPPSPQLVDSLYRETGGNPFFLEETLKAMVQARVLYRQGGAWHRRQVPAPGIPATIREAILSRLTRLAPEERRLLEIAAVYGVRIPLGTLQALVDMDQLALLDVLDHLLGLQLLEEESVPSGPVYKFAHHKIQEASYRELSAARRQLLHGHVATRLEALYGTTPDHHADELALHFGLAGQAQYMARSIAYDIRAGARAAALFAYHRAANLYLRALLHDEQAGGLLPAAELFGLLDNLGRTYERIGDYTAAAEFWDQALRLPDTGAGPAQMASLYHHLSRVHWQHGDRVRALAYCEKGLALLADHSPACCLAAALHHERFVVYLRQGFATEAAQAVQTECQAAVQSGDQVAQAQAAADQAALALWTGDPAAAVREGTPALGVLRSAGREVAQIELLVRLAWAHWALGQRRTGREHADEAVTLTQRFGLAALRSRPFMLLALMEMEEGAWENALALTQRAVDLQREHKSPSLAPYLAVRALALAHTEPTAASGVGQEAEELMGRLSAGAPSLEQLLTACALARYRVTCGETAGARRLYDLVTPLVEQTGYTFLWNVPVIGLSHLGLQPTKPEPSPGGDEPAPSAAHSGRPHGLSLREVQIIREVCKHKSDREVAEALVISRRTVTTHLTNIYNKLGLHSRTQLIEFAIQNALEPEGAE